MTQTNRAARKLAATLIFSTASMLATSSFALADNGPTIPLGEGADIATMCGTNPTVVGLVDGFGGDTWRKEVLAELKDEASKCSNITEVLYANGEGDPAKTNSDINSLVAQGVNVMIVFPDFGDSMIPAMRSATEAGVVVIPYNAVLTGTPGVDYSANVYQDLDKSAEKWAKWLNDNLKEGNLLYFSGPAGNAWSTGFMNSIQEALKPYPNLKMLQDDFVATNWNPADAQKAAAGAIAKYGKIDAVFTDFGPVAVSVLKSFEQAGLPLPYLASFAGNNELNCMYMDAKSAGRPWNYMTIEGTTMQVRNALRRGLSIYQGTENPDPLGMEAIVWADSFAGLDPKCDKSAPLNADLSGGLSDEQLQEVFK